MPRAILPLLAALLASACAPAVTREPARPAVAAHVQQSISDRLYFGRAIPGGGSVSDEDWSSFLREIVTPRFPAGLTVWRADGQWRDASGAVIREPTFVLELIHPADPGSDAAIREIIAEYRRRFRQESVLRVQDRVQASF